MTDLLSRLLASRDWIMADGATGTNLFNMGLSAGDAPEFWNVNRARQDQDALQGRGRCGQRPVPHQHLRRQRLAAEAPQRAGPGARTEPRGRRTRARDRRQGGPPRRRRGLHGPDGRDHGPDGPPHPRDRGRDVPRTGRRAEGRRRRRPLGRDDLGPRGIPRRGRGREACRHAVVRHDELRHRGPHDDGHDRARHVLHGRPPRRSAAGLRRELRRRRLGPPAHRAGLRGAGRRPADHRQGQRRASRSTTRATSTTTARPN